VAHEFLVTCYDGEGQVYEIYECEEFADAWHHWFQYLDWNRVALCTVERDGKLIFKSDVTQTGGDMNEGQRLREIWVNGHPNDYDHYSWETEMIVNGKAWPP
jgi:hypothetical protein